MPLKKPSTKFLCDTNVISELARPKPNPGVLAWAAGIRSMALSVVCLEEIFFGLAWKPNARIRSWFEEFLEQYCLVLPVSGKIARHCALLRGQLRARGKIRSQADMLIAATAQLHQLTLVTRNTRDFEECRVALLNPFD
ncbi:MAG: type II toxin-antitoxin system VapC family toxin [Acidobacteriota bacterium]